MVFCRVCYVVGYIIYVWVYINFEFVFLNGLKYWNFDRDKNNMVLSLFYVLVRVERKF